MFRIHAHPGQRPPHARLALLLKGRARSFVRAMQKSGLPIAERPNLLLKGSGRVNRILGPEEDLTYILRKQLATNEKAKRAA